MRKILGGLSEVGVCVRIRRVSFWDNVRRGIYFSPCSDFYFDIKNLAGNDIAFFDIFFAF